MGLYLMYKEEKKKKKREVHSIQRCLLHKGQEACLRSHLSMHGRWNIWWHCGKLLTVSPTWKSCFVTTTPQFINYLSINCHLIETSRTFQHMYPFLLWKKVDYIISEDKGKWGDKPEGRQSKRPSPQRYLWFGPLEFYRESPLWDPLKWQCQRCLYALGTGTRQLPSVLLYKLDEWYMRTVFESGFSCVVTWLWTALSIAGPIRSRTSLPLKRLAMTSICMEKELRIKKKKRKRVNWLGGGA